ncbi:hypothetical protein SMC26_15495 [Actinomadura fulvescens]|uniref:Uncharacterized protein n=1 Tax=Actinomadura fulvescens TaxID=46160 RepID=A0ABN3QT66_9ACTN
MSEERHPNIGLVYELSQAMGIDPVETRSLLNTAGVPIMNLNGEDVFSRRDLVAGFKSEIVKFDSPESDLKPKYSLEESAELYRSSLPGGDAMPF